VGGTRKIEARGAPARIQWRRRVPVARDGWLIVIVRGSEALTRVLPDTKATPFAFTNPVFLDVDGDGKMTPYLGNPDVVDAAAPLPSVHHEHEHP
jgi:hypothetical protein